MAVTQGRLGLKVVTGGLKVITGGGVPVVEAAVKFDVDGVGFCELIFEDDDAARRVECGAAIDQFTGPGRDSQLIAGVAAVSALRAFRCEEFRLIEAS